MRFEFELEFPFLFILYAAGNRGQEVIFRKIDFNF